MTAGGGVTLILLCYRQERFVEEAVTSALAQLGPPIEIIISDDASPDGTWHIIRSLTASYQGPHLVQTHRNNRNLGLIEHFNQTLQRVTGDIVTYLAGDDIAFPDRVRAAADLLRNDPQASFVESGFVESSPKEHFRFDQDATHAGSSIRFDLDDFVSGRAPRLSSATRTFRKAPLMAFPPLDPSLSSEDSPNALRLLMHGPGIYLDEALLYKRSHNDNITGAEGLMRIDFDIIREQYTRDFRHACATGLIDPHASRKLEAWAQGNIEARKLRRRIDLRHPGLLELYQRILPSRYLSARAKLYAIRRFLMRPSLRGRAIARRELS